MISEPCTHAMHATRCRVAAQEGRVLASQAVQVQKRGVTYCAQIVGCWTTPTGLDCWIVEASEPESCRLTVPVSKVRLCGDSICACISSAGQTGAKYEHRADSAATTVGSK